MNKYFNLLFIGIILTAVGYVNSQNKLINTEAGGEYVFNEQQLPCLTEIDRAESIRLSKESIANLRSAGIIKDNPNKAASSSFGWPIKAAAGLNDFGVYGVSNFIDQDENFPDQLLDYNGGTRTYDLSSGYNHQGTDVFTWPFSWYKMDNDHVEIVAVADGVIINKFDNNFDRNCGFGNGNWNAVYVRHTNDETVWYGHMKKNSLTTKNVGDSVKAGEYLGIVGSSGSSTGPHLHLEIYDSGFNLIDPWLGPSNPTITSSWWANQKPYYDSKINKLATHSAFPVFPNCPQTETLNIKNEFRRGDTLFIVAYYQDQIKNQVTNLALTSPENVALAQWDHIMQADHYAASWWGWSVVVPANASLGEWKFSAFFENTIYNHSFTVTDSPTDIDDRANNIANSFYLNQNYPNPFNPSTTIEYGLSENINVKVYVYDILGREVAELVNEFKSAGHYKINFNAENLNSGIYFVKISAGKFVDQRKLVLLK